MHDPPHPGEAIRVLFVECCDVSLEDAAMHLGVSSTDLTDLCEGRTGIDGEMAIRLERVLGGTAAAWMRMQGIYELAQAQLRADEIEVVPLPADRIGASD